MIKRTGRKAPGLRAQSPRRHGGDCPAGCALRIERAAHPLSATLKHMGIDHRRADIFVPQQFLHGADIVTIFQEVCRKAVAQRMTTAAPERGSMERFEAGKTYCQSQDRPALGSLRSKAYGRYTSP